MIDDGSGDSTAVTAAAAARQLALPLRVLRADFCNSGAARNFGVDHATGNFIYFLDADDEALPGGLRSLVQCLESSDRIDLAVGGHVVRIDGSPDKERLPIGFSSGHRVNVRDYLTNRRGPIPMGSALLTRRTAAMAKFAETVIYDEDTLYWAMVLSRADVQIVPRAVFVYNRDESRLAQRLLSSPRRQFLRISRALDLFAAIGIDESALRWRKGWIARGTARALIHRGDFSAASEFMRAALASGPRIRWSARTLRYLVRMRMGMLARRLGIRRLSRPGDAEDR